VRGGGGVGHARRDLRSRGDVGRCGEMWGDIREILIGHARRDLEHQRDIGEIQGRHRRDIGEI
jgi:hypothetical protein